MPTLTYTSHTHTLFQAILADAETLGGLTGPGVFYVPVDGASAACRDVWAQGLPIDDPLDGAGVKEALDAKAAALEAEAKKPPAEREKEAAEPKVQAETSYPPGSPVSIYPQPGDFVIKRAEAEEAGAKKASANKSVAKEAPHAKKAHSGR